MAGENEPSGQASKNFYQHEPLSKSPSSIRLLQIHGTDVDGSLSCSLHESMLAHEEYYALSYVWGLPWPKHDIKINGKTFSVTANVWTFLRYATVELSNLEGNAIWLDALCINQTDQKEKSRQIPLIGRIYEGATKVFAWLPGDYHVRATMSNSSSQTIFDGPASLAKAIQCDTIPITRSPIPSFLAESFVRLLQHVIWSRLWTVQEILLASKIDILWEGQHIPWSKLAGLIEAVFFTGRRQTALSQYIRRSANEADLEQLKSSLPIFDFFTSDSEQQQRSPAEDFDAVSPILKDLAGVKKSRLEANLVRSIQQYSNHDCSIVQDRVFAMLAICNDGQSLTPTYSESRFALLVRVLANHYRKWGRMLDENDCNTLTLLLELDVFKGIQLEIFSLSAEIGITSEHESFEDNHTNLAANEPGSAANTMRVCDQCMTYPLNNYKRLIWIPSTRVILGTMDDWLSFQSSSRNISETVQAIFQLDTASSQSSPNLHETVSRSGIPYIPIEPSGTFSNLNCWYDLLGATMPIRKDGEICPGRSSQKSIFSERPAHVAGLVPGKRIGTSDDLDHGLDLGRLTI